MTYVRSLFILLALAALAALTGCAEPAADESAGTTADAPGMPSDLPCDPDNGGLTLPDGFCAVVVADSTGRGRHIAVADNGDVYLALRRPTEEGGIAALRDTDGDGRADVTEFFGAYGGTGIGLRDGYLYFAPDTMVMRYARAEGELVPSGEPETIVADFINQSSHAVKPFAFDGAGHIYVNVGAPSNACQEASRTPGSPGLDPCPQLERQAGVWRFSADTPGQTQVDDGHRFASGIRNSVAIAWNPAVDQLYVVQHGRDQLDQLFPETFTAEQRTELPAEEFLLVNDGDDFGWPYCYYDHLQGAKVLGPEYGGDGQEVGRCADAEDPILGFPGHYAPNDLLFYTGEQFPGRYHNGAFVAFHGSWNREPPQRGYQVAFVPMDGELPAGDWETFADGFAGSDSLATPGDAEFRPMGLAVGPDGSLYIADSVKGKVWRIVYKGESAATD